MDYELCKKLKAAGFPQEVNYGDWIFCLDKTRYFIGNSDDMGDTTGGWNPNTKKESTTAKDDKIKIPTLSELIRECGKGFGELGLLGEGGEFEWFATDSINGERNYGHTPEEAVAMLYLKLHE